MTTVDLPLPPVHRRSRGEIDLDRLQAELTRRVDGEVRFDAGSRAAYSTDASNYRQTPIAVVAPRSVDAVVETVAVCHELGAPVVSRGGGTSLAGQACNVAVVIDWSKYLHHVLEIDAEARTARVQPGVVLDTLREQAKQHGLTYGPDPATHSHCTLGGMIGNNSCGVHALMAGKTSDNVLWLDVLTHDGLRMRVEATSDEQYAQIQAEGGRRAQIYAGLKQLADAHGDEVRERFPDIPRRVSGYNLDALLPEAGFDVAQALVGTESTCVTVLEAGLRLVDEPGARALVVLGFDDIAAAADAVPAVLEHEPIGLEGMDHLVFDYTREKHLEPEALDKMPPGQGWLLVELGADDRDAAVQKAQRLVDAAQQLPGSPSHKLFEDRDEEQQVWAVREAALAAATRQPASEITWPGWEDSAVAVPQLGSYLRELRQLYDRYGYKGSIYGHFGQGCVHSRISFDLRSRAGIETFDRFMNDAADLCLAHGGSLSGEHGDGQARASLLPKMFGDELVTAMRQFKGLFDPDNLMNPGKMVAPYLPTENLRLGAEYRPARTKTAFAFPDDEHDFAVAALRCVGVGNCRRQEPSGGVMCPSYQVTREEEHSTRGRARLLFEMLNGERPDSAVTDGWRSEAVKDSLDLCLSCKGCKSDCPVNVDMATYKAEFLHQHYQRRLRPLAHYSMGWLPVLAVVAAKAPGLVNALTAAPGLRRLISLAGGLAPQREVPRFADEPFVAWFTRGAVERDGLLVRAAATGKHGRRVLLWPDTFNNHLHPAVAVAAARVLHDAGYEVCVPAQRVCCGLTWISTGQLDVAKHVLGRTLDLLEPYLDTGGLVIGLEPSCTAVFRSDLHDLLPGDEVGERLRSQTVTLAELLVEHTPEWQPPTMAGTAISQTHCHQHAVMGFGPDEALMATLGLDQSTLDSGCCGLAGNFGFEKGHYEVSMAVGEQVLLPAVRAAEDTTIVTADGFSCRTQIEGATDRQALHLAQVLALAMDGGLGDGRPEDAAGDPTTTGGGGRSSVWSQRPGVVAGVLSVGAGLAWMARRRRSG